MPHNFFPACVRSEQESLSFLKKLTAMSISTLLYHRGMFSHTDYGTRTQDEQCLHILDRNAATPAAKRIVDLVSSTFRAIDKKVLHTIVIGIVDDPAKPDEFLESYTFKFQYFDQQDSLSLDMSDSEPTEQAMLLLQQLKQVAQGIKKKAEKDLFFTMRLLYCELAPDGYEPNGFTTRPVDTFEIKGQSEGRSCGRVLNRFTGFRLKVETDAKLYAH